MNRPKSPPLNVRQATESDTFFFLECHNDPITRAMSKTSHVVAPDEHDSWFSERLSREEPHLYIAEINGVSVGTMRIDDDELSYTTAPEHRGRGYATQMLNWARQKFGPLRAEIYQDNLASIRTAQKTGHVVKILSRDKRNK